MVIYLLLLSYFCPPPPLPCSPPSLPPRWRHQAQLTAAAVMDAKNEVLERKRELDMTRDKMDNLIDKLYAGTIVGQA